MRGLRGAISTANLPKSRASFGRGCLTAAHGTWGRANSPPCRRALGAFCRWWFQSLDGWWGETRYTEHRNCISGCGAELCLSYTLGREGKCELGRLSGAWSWRRACWTLPWKLSPGSSEPQAASGSCLAWQLQLSWAGRAAQSTCSLPAAVSICPAQHHQQQGPARSSGAGRAALSSLEDAPNLQAGSPAVSRERDQPSAMAVLSCKHSKALLPVSGFTMKVMAAHVGALLHFVHAPQPLWHLQENKTASGI